MLHYSQRKQSHSSVTMVEMLNLNPRNKEKAILEKIIVDEEEEQRLEREYFSSN